MPKLRLFIVSICAEHALSACGVLAIRANCVVPEQTMTEYPYILFNKSPEQMRILGARGGKAYGRNRRTRRALLADTQPPAVPTRAHPRRPAAHLLAKPHGRRRCVIRTQRSRSCRHSRTNRAVDRPAFGGCDPREYRCVTKPARSRLSLQAQVYIQRWPGSRPAESHDPLMA